jgi:hypothetical protein
MDDRHNDRVKVKPFLGQDVLVALGPGLIRYATQNTVTYQLLEPVGEYMPRYAESRLEILEAPHAQEAVSQDEKRPPVADDRHCTGNRTLLLL